MAEAVLGITALVLPRPWWAGLVALSYVVFAGFVAYARSTGGAIASCGCFGTPDTPATLVHVVIDGVLALSAAAVAWSRHRRAPWSPSSPISRPTESRWWR